MIIWHAVDLDDETPSLFSPPQVRLGDVVGGLTVNTDDDAVTALIAIGTPPFREAIYLTEEQLQHALLVIETLIEGIHVPRTLRRDKEVTPALAEVEN